MPKFRHAELLEFAGKLFLQAGLPRNESRLVANLLLKADLEGYSGHGLSHIQSYLDRMKNGLIRLDTRSEIVREGKTTAVINGNFYIGQVVAHEGMMLAIKKAREHGIGVVSIRRSAHVGRLADYVEMAARENFIGIAAVSVGGNSITTYGAMEPVAGTNPMAFGIPRRNGLHIIFDFATAAMSMGELRKKVDRGEAVPANVMLDAGGNPTTDFKRFQGPPKGVVLPFGHYKGSGIHLMAEILGGILTGNGLGKEWWEKGGPAVNGVFLQALAIEEFQPLEKFFEKMEELVLHVKSKKPAPGFKEIFLPGEQSRRRTEKTMREGVEIHIETWENLKRKAEEWGLTDMPEPIA